MGVPKFPQVGLPQLWGPIILHANLWLRWTLNQSCNPHQELCSGMWHAICTQGNWGDFWLLVVRSQIGNLIHDPSFGYNLCVKCPNGSCEPFLNIYVPKTFQWCKKLLNTKGFDPYNCFLKIQKFTKIPTLKLRSHLGVWGFIPSLFYTPRNMKCDSQTSLLVRTSTSPCLGGEPKDKVATPSTSF